MAKTHLLVAVAEVPQDPLPAPVDPPIPPGLAEVGRYATERDAADHGLVVLAMRLGYWVEPVPGAFSLRVAESAAADVRTQLALYDRETSGWPPRFRPLAKLRLHWPLPLAWAVSTAVTFHLQMRSAGRFEAFGALRGDAVFGAGEWWRPATALFLHADLGHMVSNVGAGVFLFALVLGGLGAMRGGLAVAASAVLGNVLAAALHPQYGYASLGASTAIFGALGILTGAAARRAIRLPLGVSWRTLLPPLLAGGALLALYGGGGMRTDVIAHATGFFAGLILGAVVRAHALHGAPDPTIGSRPIR